MSNLWTHSQSVHLLPPGSKHTVQHLFNKLEVSRLDSRLSSFVIISTRTLSFSSDTQLGNSCISWHPLQKCKPSLVMWDRQPMRRSPYTGADPGFDRGGGGAQIVTRLKLPFWGLSFVEFWCWGLIFGGRGGAGPPPLIRPWYNKA